MRPAVIPVRAVTSPMNKQPGWGTPPDSTTIGRFWMVGRSFAWVAGEPIASDLWHVGRTMVCDPVRIDFPLAGQPTPRLAQYDSLRRGGGGDRRPGGELLGSLRDSLHRLQLQPASSPQGDLHRRRSLDGPTLLYLLGLFRVFRRPALDQWPLAGPGPPPVARVSGRLGPHRMGSVDHGSGLPALGPVVPGPGGALQSSRVFAWA